MSARTVDLARGKWRGILLQLGIDGKYLTGKHGPCPMCEGVDRFRFDNKDGKGTFICGQCGAGNGFDLLMQAKGMDFKTAATAVDKVVGRVTHEPPPKRIDEQARRKMLNDLWFGSVPITQGDMAHRYLSSRCRSLPQSLPDLRFNEAAPAPGGSVHPAIIALVKDAAGKPCTIHRTFLGKAGKADTASPRALMPGPVADGAAVRLFQPGKVLGIAEGIETAFCAADRFGVPVWSAINSTMLAKWAAPEGVEEVIVFGDCDAKFGGQAAAYTLAHRLSGKVAKVTVQIPDEIGTDWADMIEQTTRNLKP